MLLIKQAWRTLPFIATLKKVLHPISLGSTIKSSLRMTYQVTYQLNNKVKNQIAFTYNYNFIDRLITNLVQAKKATYKSNPYHYGSVFNRSGSA